MITLEDIQKNIGLSDKEARVYFALLKEGSGYASAIATEAGIKRSTAYQILNRLHEYGLVHKYIKGKKFYFTRSKPRNVLRFLKDREEQARNRTARFESMLPEMQAYYVQKEKKPKLVYFDKKQQVENLLLESLSVPGTDGVVGFLSLDALMARTGDKLLESFAKELGRRKVSVKLIDYDESVDAKKNADTWVARYFSALPNELRPQIKTIATSCDLSAFTLISGHKVFLIDIVPPEYMGTAIYNQDMAQGIKTIFDNLWKKLK